MVIKLLSPKLDFSDVLIVPKKSHISSRSMVKLNRNFTFKYSNKVWSGLPIISSNMDTVTNIDTFNILKKHNMLSCFPKKYNKDWLDNPYPLELNEVEHYCLCSGINKRDLDVLNGLLLKLKDNNIVPSFVCFDVANGYMIDLIKTCYNFRVHNPGITVIAGNVVTPDGVRELVTNGIVDIVKVGIGSGCFDGNTRVLMATGIYKNIKDIKVNDYVINKDGKPVKVLNVMNQGVKPVLKVTTNNWHDDFYVTKDHRYWIGDLSTSSNNCIMSSGIAKLLDKQSKTKPKSSKYKWKQIGEIKKDKMFCLLPNTFEWTLPSDFTIDLSNNLIRGVCTEDKIITSGNGSIKTHFNRKIKSSYKLGYLFGTFLGDGCSNIVTYNKSEIGSCTWYFGPDEMDIAKRVKEYIYDILSYECSIVVGKTINVCCYNKCISRMFYEFGKREKKHLPEKYYCTDKEYIKGIFDGLVDSDGSIEVTAIGNIINTFNNTSKPLIELYNWCCMNLGLSFCSMKRKKTTGNLKSTHIDNLKQAYAIKTHTLNRYTKDYVYSVIHSIEEYDERETWDIEVDCPTHSFIANNSIVHNSVCTTRKITGVGYPQFSAVVNCSEKAHELGAHIISDGGVNFVGDISKAFCGGADFVMLGSFIGGHIESPGDIICENEKYYKMIYGMSSKLANEKYSGGLGNYKAAEGKVVKILVKGSLDDTLQKIKGGLRSTCSYIGVDDLSLMNIDQTFIQVNRQYNSVFDKNTIEE